MLRHAGLREGLDGRGERGVVVGGREVLQVLRAGSKDLKGRGYVLDRDGYVVPIAPGYRGYVVLPDESDKGEGELHPLLLDLLSEEGVEFDNVLITCDKRHGQNVLNVSTRENANPRLQRS